MTVTMNRPRGAGRKLGWLIWWTIHQGAYDEGKLKSAATDAGIPAWVADRIRGRTEKSAWTVATQLGASGSPSANQPGEDGGMRCRYLVRDIDFETPTRAIVREVINRSEERVSSETVALVRLWIGELTHEIIPDLPAGLLPELLRLIEGMRSRMTSLKGKVGDAKARSLLLDYLAHRYRVCVRGSGGVYLVPKPSKPSLATQIEGELVALRDWVSNEPLSSLFSIVELTDAGATTVDVFVQSAVEELRNNIQDIDGRLDEWAANERMNAGSRGFSAREMMKRCSAAAKKMAALESALGDEVGITREMLDLVQRKAQKMQHGSAIVIGRARAKREREREAGGNDKKSGTAKGRAKRVKL
jgi:hypothetical protein